MFNSWLAVRIRDGVTGEPPTIAYDNDAVFYDPLLFHKFENMVIFLPGNLYWLCNPENQNYIFNYFSSKNDFDQFNEFKLKSKYFADHAGFLGYKLNISFLTENYHIPKFRVQKWARPKNGVNELVSCSAREGLFKISINIVGVPIKWVGLRFSIAYKNRNFG